MSFKSFALGVDQRSIPNIELGTTLSKEPGNLSGLSNLVNVRLHPNDYYIADRGWEPLKIWSDGDGHSYKSNDFEPIRWASVFNRHAGAEQYYLYEQNGYLKYDYGAGEASSGATVYLPSEITRHIPEPTEPGTQMVTSNNWALICNGYDQPFKFFGSSYTTNFGFKEKPAAPEVYDIDPGYQSTGPDGDFGDQTFITSVQYVGTSQLGLTELDETGNISYAYKVFYISDTGSWSPLSEPAFLDFSVGNNADEKGQYIAFLRLPIGPNNVKARVLCRTQQLSRSDRNAGTISNDFFIVKVINENTSEFCSDHTPDSNLSLKAPTDFDSVPILGTFNFAALWDGRMWLAGGPAYQSKVLFSKQAKIEEFGLFDYINFSQGDAITALITYNQNLLVFTEKSIHLISKADTYRAVTLTTSLGTTATNSIKDVEGVGLVFLSYDGFYAIRLDGTNANPNFSINKLSEAITPTISRLTKGALPRATATYNPIEREYWCHFPVDGLEENTMGCVLHQNGNWSFRYASDEFDFRKMTITALTNDGTYTIMGMIPYDTIDEASTEDGEWTNIGLQVWSGAPTAGKLLSGGQLVESSYYFNLSNIDKIESKVETIWLTLGSEAFYKKVLSIELLAYGTGHDEITLQYATNYNLSGEDSPWTDLTGVPMVASHSVGSTSADAVYSANTYDPVGVWGTTRYNEYRPIRMVWNLPPDEVISIKFRFSSDKVFAIQQFNIKFDITATPIVSTASRR